MALVLFFVSHVLWFVLASVLSPLLIWLGSSPPVQCLAPQYFCEFIQIDNTLTSRTGLLPPRLPVPVRLVAPVETKHVLAVWIHEENIVQICLFFPFWGCHGCDETPCPPLSSWFGRSISLLLETRSTALLLMMPFYLRLHAWFAPICCQGQLWAPQPLCLEMNGDGKVDREKRQTSHWLTVE